MNLLKHPLIVFWLSSSFIAMILAVLLGIFLPNNTLALIIAVIISQAASSIFFPIIVSHFYDQFTEEERGNEIWRIFKEFADGGIIRVYKDREESINPDNATNELRKAFLRHDSGDVKLIGVSLRVFFNPTGPFYQAINTLLSNGEIVSLNILLLHPESTEAKDRADIETPIISPPLITRDISLTAANINYLQESYPRTPINFGYYSQAPYCTLVLFPDKCFFSPNLLSNIVPVRLPLIVFRKGSHGYHVLNAYFNYIWDRKLNFEQNSGELIT